MLPLPVYVYGPSLLMMLERIYIQNYNYER